MANTIVKLDVVDDALPSVCRLAATPGATGSPAAAYLMSADSSNSWLFDITVSESLVGIFRVVIEDSDGLVVAAGYVYLQDDAATYYAVGDYLTCVTHSNSLQAQADVAAVANQITDLDADVAALASSITTLASNVSDVADNVTTVIDAIGTLQTTANNIASAVGAVNGLVVDVDGDVVNVAAQLTELTEDVLEIQIIVNAIQDQTDRIGVGTVTDATGRFAEDVLTIYTKETHEIEIATSDYTARTLELVFEKKRTDIVTIANDNITKEVDKIKFNIPSALSDVSGRSKWSLRDTTTSEVLLDGICDCRYRAEKDA